MSAISTASTPSHEDHARHHAPKVLSLAPIRAILDLRSLEALAVVSETLLDDETSWLLGDDRSTMLTTHADLTLLVRIMKEGLRDDVTISSEATRLSRALQSRFRRDHAGGICTTTIDVLPLLNPDAQ